MQKKKHLNLVWKKTIVFLFSMIITGTVAGGAFGDKVSEGNPGIVSAADVFVSLKDKPKEIHLSKREGGSEELLILDEHSPEFMSILQQLGSLELSEIERSDFEFDAKEIIKSKGKIKYKIGIYNSEKKLLNEYYLSEEAIWNQEHTIYTFTECLMKDLEFIYATCKIQKIEIYDVLHPETKVELQFPKNKKDIYRISQIIFDLCEEQPDKLLEAPQSSGGYRLCIAGAEEQMEEFIIFPESVVHNQLAYRNESLYTFVSDKEYF